VGYVQELLCAVEAEVLGFLECVDKVCVSVAALFMVEEGVELVCEGCRVLDCAVTTMTGDGVELLDVSVCYYLVQSVEPTLWAASPIVMMRL
jgi:hypothetical protein